MGGTSSETGVCADRTPNDTLSQRDRGNRDDAGERPDVLLHRRGNRDRSRCAAAGAAGQWHFHRARKASPPGSPRERVLAIVRRTCGIASARPASRAPSMLTGPVANSRGTSRHDAWTRAPSSAIRCAMHSRMHSTTSRDACGTPAHWIVARKRVSSRSASPPLSARACSNTHQAPESQQQGSIAKCGVDQAAVASVTCVLSLARPGYQRSNSDRRVPSGIPPVRTIRCPEKPEAAHAVIRWPNVGDDIACNIGGQGDRARRAANQIVETAPTPP